MADAYVKPEYPLSEVTARIIGAARRVHVQLGPGFEEVIYQRALELELLAEGLSYSREVWMDVHYRGKIVGRKRLDFVIEGSWWRLKHASSLRQSTWFKRHRI